MVNEDGEFVYSSQAYAKIPSFGSVENRNTLLPKGPGPGHAPDPRDLMMTGTAWMMA